MGLEEMRQGCVDWIYLSQDKVKWMAVVNTAMNIQVALGVMSILNNSGIASSTRMTLFNGVN